MANQCSNSLVVKRIDGGKLTDEEIGAFIRKEDSPEHQGTKVEFPNSDIKDIYFFSYQFVVPVKQDENWRDNNINNWGCKRDGAYTCAGILTEKALVLDFDTPRSPPDKWCIAVCKKFPELCISLEYDEPGCGFQGEMGRDEEGKLFDNYRDGDAYLHTCNRCEIHYEDGQTQWRSDAGSYLCNECYEEFLSNNKKEGEK